MIQSGVDATKVAKITRACEIEDNMLCRIGSLFNWPDMLGYVLTRERAIRLGGGAWGGEKRQLCAGIAGLDVPGFNGPIRVVVRAWEGLKMIGTDRRMSEGSMPLSKPIVESLIRP